MNESVKEYMERYSTEIKELYAKLRDILYHSVSQKPEEKLWAKLPSYYVGEAFVRFIPFKDHINIEALAVAQHRDELDSYHITPKGMLQVYLFQPIPAERLARIFEETLTVL